MNQLSKGKPNMLQVKFFLNMFCENTRRFHKNIKFTIFLIIIFYIIIYKDLYKDPTIEAIMSKRPAYIENAYNKNLRRASTFTQSSEINSNLNIAHNNIDLNEMNNNNNNLRLYSEKTDVTDLMSVINLRDKNSEDDDDNNNNDENDDSDDENGNRNNKYGSKDGGASSYQAYCYDLKIGPSSIVLKSLLTTSLSLSNYGLNSTGLLALATALKVNNQIFSIKSTNKNICFLIIISSLEILKSIFKYGFKLFLG
jgi:hypothetical protein